MSAGGSRGVLDRWVGPKPRGRADRIRFSSAAVFLAVLVAGQVATAWFGVPADVPSERSWNLAGLAGGLAIILPFGAGLAVVYLRSVKEPWVAAATGVAIAGTFAYAYVEMTSTNSSTAGLGYIAVLLYPWAIVGVGAGISDFLERRRRRPGDT